MDKVDKHKVEKLGMVDKDKMDKVDKVNKVGKVFRVDRVDKVDDDGKLDKVEVLVRSRGPSRIAFQFYFFCSFSRLAWHCFKHFESCQLVSLWFLNFLSASILKIISFSQKFMI